MGRARTGALALAVVGLCTTQAQAAPVAYDARYLQAELRLVGGDGADWRLLLSGTQTGAVRTETPTSADPQQLRVTALRCAADACREAGSWRIALGEDQIDVADDGASARLDAVLFGRRLSVGLTPAGVETGTVHLVAGGAPAREGDTLLDLSRSVEARGKVALGGLSCAVATGVIGQAVVVAEQAAPPAGDGRAPAGLLDGPVRCSA